MVEKYSMGSIVNGVIVLYGDRYSYICVEHSIIYKVVDSLCCTPETNVTLCVNCSSIKKEKNPKIRTETQKALNNQKNF